MIATKCLRGAFRFVYSSPSRNRIKMAETWSKIGPHMYIQRTPHGMMLVRYPKQDCAMFEVKGNYRKHVSKEHIQQ